MTAVMDVVPDGGARQTASMVTAEARTAGMAWQRLCCGPGEWASARGRPGVEVSGLTR